MCRNSHFGVLNIIFLQILQLPSVKRNQPSVPISFLESQQRIGASGTLDVWKTFQYDELTINMRQRNDKTYTDILSRLCVGHTTTGDCSVLREKLITNASVLFSIPRVATVRCNIQADQCPNACYASVPTVRVN